LRPQGVLQVGKVLLLPMSVVLGDCCPTSLILKIQDVCKSEELKVSEKEEKSGTGKLRNEKKRNETKRKQNTTKSVK
jgi:hypothetical protein